MYDDPVTTTSMPTPAKSSSSVSTNTLSPDGIRSRTPRQWEGIFTASARSDKPCYYGPGSAFYFVSRIGSYLGKTLQQPMADQAWHPQGASQVLDSLDAQSDQGCPASASAKPLDDSRPSMPRAQEERFLGLFWEAYHCIMPILDEAEFAKHYNALWDTPGPHRKPSALVDAMLALCMQYGITFIPRVTAIDSSRSSPAMACDDATIAGKLYYRRCEMLLMSDLESPSIATLQCYLFSILYLCLASFQTVAHIQIAGAVRIAQVLGLHLEPPADMPSRDRELRKRMWWIVACFEYKGGMKHSRPFCIDERHMNVTWPSDGVETAMAAGSRFGLYATDVTWLSYSLQFQKMIMSAAEIFRSVNDRWGMVLAQRQTGSLYKDLDALEQCAEHLASKLPILDSWLEQLPDGLKTPRKGAGKPYALDQSALDINFLAPRWLQRQRILLETQYHYQAMALRRSFIVFSPNSDTYIPFAEQHAAACVKHSMTFTKIMHQALNETDLVAGWGEYFMGQWAVTIALIGFVLAYPVHPSTPAARQALDKAVAIFDAYSVNIAEAASAAKITRDLIAKVDLISDRLRSGASFTAPEANPATAMEVGDEYANTGEDALAWLDPSGQYDSDYFNGFMDWALSVELFNNYESMYGISGDPNNTDG